MKGLARSLVPLLLAVTILIGGVAVPKLLLTLQRRELGREPRQMAVEDVRPYGEGYEEMRDSLRFSARLMERMAKEYDGLLEIGSSLFDAEARNAAAQTEITAFMTAWSEAIPELFPGDQISEMLRLNPQDALFSDGGLGCLVQVGVGDDAGLGAMGFCDAATGAPVHLELALVPETELTLRQIWDGLPAAYESCLGLRFGKAQLMEYTSAKGVTFVTRDLGIDEVEMEPGSYVRVCAVSTDMVFELWMFAYTDGEHWWLSVELKEYESFS